MIFNLHTEQAGVGKRVRVPEPVTAKATALREKLDSKRWASRAKKALAKADLVERVRQRAAADGLSLFQGLSIVSPKTPWPTFQYWCRLLEGKLQAPWETLLDHRMPPEPKVVPDIVRATAEMARRLRPDIEYEEVRSLLVAQHGEAGDISDSSLLRIWRAAGLINEAAAKPQVTELHGGAGLALIGAAALETGASLALANALIEGAQHTVARQPVTPVPAEPSGRDEKGRLTAEYNKSARAGCEPGTADNRWEPDYKKRQHRDLAGQRVLQERPETLAQKVLAVGVMPLITERRGFDGLDGPQGEWLEALFNGVPYKPRTLDKFVSQLGLLDVEDDLWHAHAQLSIRYINRWATMAGGPPWLAMVMYIDATQDAHWTRKYALSGKVSRTGRVGPCLNRVAVSAGPGIPFIMETYPGTVSLKTELLRLHERVQSLVGDGVRRLTIIDAEMSTAKLLTAMSANSDQAFVTVLKGRSMNDYQAVAEWQSFRERDKIREGTLVIRGAGAPETGLQLRVVEMHRDGRHGQSTFFATSHTIAELSTTDVVEAYLSRWPNQEQVFRNTRNGLGLRHSHGFSGEMVHHVALDTKSEKAQRHLKRVGERETQAREAVTAAERDNPQGVLAKTARRELAAAKKALNDAKKTCEKLASTPKLIYERDTARENVVTACTMNVLFLIEFVLREYFGGVRMELRTFIEHFVNMPTTIVTTTTEITFQVHANPRNRERTEQMRQACAEVTQRQLKRGGRRLAFVLLDRERKPVTV